MNCKVDLEIDIQVNETEKKALSLIEKALNEAAKMEDCPAVEVVLSIVDNERIQQLNQQFRQVDRVTDVLSFPQWESDEDWIVEEEDQAVLLGDIVISLPKAQDQATEYGHTLQRELCFLAVHGFLHLLGYDHESTEAEEEMFAKQKEILRRIGLQR